ncbi:MAG: dTDP-4-amino-4,6-dideoxygalactose transaminase [Gemmatimonadota bacterium]|nr:MAG: dTDP-4-amino-4,6-dideoxygalactose transaminase [Gemmatimonadota bacterium]
MSIRFNVPYLTGRELEYLQRVIDNRTFAGNGPFTAEVSRKLEERYDVPRVLLTHGCTAALEMAALLLDLGPNDEVIVPSYTFPSTAAAFVRVGAKVVFCEIDPATMMIDPADAARRVTLATRAIVPVHYGGIACDMDAIMSLAKKHELTVVEDAAQGLEASLNGRWLGTIAPLGCLSFHETKNLHAGLAGALFLNDLSYAERAEAIWERGTDRQKVLRGLIDKYTWVEVGSSFYPSELQAAFLAAQLESIQTNLAERRALYDAYQQGLAPLANAGHLRLPRVDPGRQLNYHACYVIFNSAADCDAVREHLKSKDIWAYIGYVPLHSSPVGRRLGYQPDDLPITEEHAPRVLRLPLHNELSTADVRRVCDAVREYFEG